MIIIDCLVIGLLLVSACINIIALGAFWVTPSLRTTANRFVVNLLAANLVCCFILGPSLLVSEITTPVNEFDPEFNQTENKLKYTLTEIRCWGLDFAAAMGTLAILLVVGDTWCAITDPLRYHTRMSDIKAWFYITTTWILGIIFGIASAFRAEYTSSTPSILTKELQNETTVMLSDYAQDHIIDSLYDTIFSYSYFITVIFIPFVLVCAMYWRIFSEAREGGQRMRKNASSPLIQSGINLSPTLLKPNEDAISDIITLKIDSPRQTNYSRNILGHSNFQNGQLKSSLKPPSTHQSRIDLKMSPLPQNKVQMKRNSDNNQNNILLAINNLDHLENKSNHLEGIKVSNTKIKRNNSARNLVMFDNDNEKPVSNLRPSRSTPNLLQIDDEVFNPNLDNHNMLQMPTLILPPSKSLGYVSSLRHRLSNASSIFKYREESRAARISILVVIMLLVSYLPYGILVLMQGLNIKLKLASNHALLAIFAVVTANISTPFIFAYRTKSVRRGVRRLLRIERRTSKKLSRATSNIQLGNQNQPKPKIQITPPENMNKNENSLEVPDVVIEITSCDTTNYQQKPSFLKHFCDNSRKLGCASCSDEQTDV